MITAKEGPLQKTHPIPAFGGACADSPMIAMKDAAENVDQYRIRRRPTGKCEM